MRLIFLLLGAASFAALVFSIGTWYLQPLLFRQIVLRRLNRQGLIARLTNKLTKRQKSGSKHSALLGQLSELSDLLDATARNLRLGKSMASALKSATETGAIKDPVIGELVALTTRGESFAEVTKRLLPMAKANDLIFALRTIDLAATGGVGGVLALERAAIVLRGSCCG